MIRICPRCNCEVVYKNKISFTKSKKENKPCKTCSNKEVANRPEERLKNSERQKGKTSGDKNHFYGKKHTEESLIKLKKNAKRLNGSKNTMYGKSFYDVWVEKYGKEVADIKLIDYKNKKSIRNMGCKNPMYGKPSPQGSGNGWSGWYKGWFFRSINELSYMVNIIERFNLDWKSAESKEFKITYTNWDGIKRNYYPDFIINNKYIVECKPKSLWSSPSVHCKTIGAKIFCKENNFIYKLTECRRLEYHEISKLYSENIIIFTKKYEKKYREYTNTSS